MSTCSIFGLFLCWSVLFNSLLLCLLLLLSLSLHYLCITLSVSFFLCFQPNAYERHHLPQLTKNKNLSESPDDFSPQIVARKHNTLFQSLFYWMKYQNNVSEAIENIVHFKPDQKSIRKMVYCSMKMENSHLS